MAYYLIKETDYHYTIFEGTYRTGKDGVINCKLTNCKYYSEDGAWNANQRWLADLPLVRIPKKTFNALKDNALKIGKMREMWLTTAKAIFEHFSIDC